MELRERGRWRNQRSGWNKNSVAFREKLAESGRGGGVVVSVLDYRSNDPSSSLACHDIFQYNCTVIRKDENI